MKYDYLIVGAGLFGSVFAYEAKKRGKKCLIIDNRDHVGGNVYCENIEGVNIHKYGAHIFHTNDEFLWNYVNSITPFNNYINSPVALAKGKLYNLPFNMNTFYQLWGVITPEEAQNKLNEQTARYLNKTPKNLEEQALTLVGEDIYQTLIKEYTEKQWGKKAIDLPSFIIRRLPIRMRYDNNYFNDRFQGIPIGGYNKLIDGFLKDIDVQLKTDYFKNKEELNKLSDKIVYTGKIDEFFEYEFGELSYRSLRFETERLNISNFQGNAVVNYNDAVIPYTRIIEHKYFEFGQQDHTVITKEYPQDWDRTKEAYYPINDDKNQTLFKKYQAKTKEFKNVIFGGRLAEYRYYDMHQVIASALYTVKKEFV